MAVTINGRDASDQPPEPPKKDPKPKPLPRAKFVQITADRDGCPVAALDGQGNLWRFVAKPIRRTEFQSPSGYERYWELDTAERRAG